MKLNSFTLGAVILVILFGGIAASAIPGWWQTESTKEPAKFTVGEAAGLSNPADIRGSYTFADIEAAFGVPATELASAFALPEGTDAAAFQVKTLESLFALEEGADTEIGTESVRLFTAFYTGLPFDYSTDIYLVEPAGAILEASGKLDPERLEYLNNHLVPAPVLAEPMGVESQPAEELLPTAETPEAGTGEEYSSEDRMVKGLTTFGELLDWGVAQEKIEAILGAPMPNRLVKVKDYCTEANLSFSTIKAALQAEVDQAP